MGSAVVTLSSNSVFIIFTVGRQLPALLTSYLILRGLSLKLLEIKVYLPKSWHRHGSDMVDSPIQFSITITPNDIKIAKQLY